MRLPETVDGSPAPAGSPTHILDSGMGGSFAFGYYHAANDSWVDASPATLYHGDPIHGPDATWLTTQNASGRVLNIVSRRQQQRQSWSWERAWLCRTAHYAALQQCASCAQHMSLDHVLIPRRRSVCVHVGLGDGVRRRVSSDHPPRNQVRPSHSIPHCKPSRGARRPPHFEPRQHHDPFGVGRGHDSRDSGGF
jgi:hypothetical protein